MSVTAFDAFYRWIVMEGFLNLRIKPWLRRIITRAIAIAPAAFVAFRYGEKGTEELLILSQVVLSLQLPTRRKVGLAAIFATGVV